MGEFILFLAIFVGIMAVTALVFGGWFLVMIIRGIATFLGLRSPARPPLAQRRPGAAPKVTGGNHRLCPYELCKAPNDAAARFCRRCGRQMPAPAHVHVRRAAVW